MFYCRLHRHGLRALNVGGHGDCLFTTITFQLHSHANYHSEIRTTGIQYLREETNKKPLTPGVVNLYCSVKCLSAQCSLFFFLSESKVKQSIVYIAISQCFLSIFHLINFITSSGTKEVAFLEILKDHFLTQLNFIPLVVIECYYECAGLCSRARGAQSKRIGCVHGPWHGVF